MSAGHGEGAAVEVEVATTAAKSKKKRKRKSKALDEGEDNDSTARRYHQYPCCCVAWSVWAAATLSIMIITLITDGLAPNVRS